MPTRVLIVDDSIFMRSVLKSALDHAHDIEVIGTAQNGAEGLQKIRSLKPDVITLDVEMPGMTGIEVLEHIMREAPRPARRCSSNERMTRLRRFAPYRMIPRRARLIRNGSVIRAHSTSVAPAATNVSRYAVSDGLYVARTA